MKTVTTKEYGYVVIGSESTVMINSLYSHAEKEEAKKEAIRLSKENPNEYFYVLEIHNRTNTAEDIVYDEEQSSEITDYGQSVCCEKGRIRYRGGSMYFCDWCGEEEIRPCFSLKPYTGEVV